MELLGDFNDVELLTVLDLCLFVVKSASLTHRVRLLDFCSLNLRVRDRFSVLSLTIRARAVAVTESLGLTIS